MNYTLFGSIVQVSNCLSDPNCNLVSHRQWKRSHLSPFPLIWKRKTQIQKFPGNKPNKKDLPGAIAQQRIPR